MNRIDWIHREGGKKGFILIILLILSKEMRVGDAEDLSNRFVGQGG
jgi:hypothetical protein